MRYMRRHRFTIDARVRGSDIDHDSLQVTARLTDPEGLTDDWDVTEHLMLTGGPEDWRTWRSTPADGFAERPLTLAATVHDRYGALALEAALTVDVGQLTPHFNPLNLAYLQRRLIVDPTHQGPGKVAGR